MAQKKPQAEIEFSVYNQEFSKGIKEMNSDMKLLTSELKLNSAQLKGNSDDADLLADRQAILSKQLELSSEKVKATEEALKKAGDELGENSKEYKNLTSALLRAKTEQQNIQNELKTTISRIDSQSEAVENLGDNFEEASESTSTFSDVLKANLSADLIKGIADSVVGLGKDLIGLAKETREYRSDLSRLEQNTKNANLNFDGMKDRMNNLVALTGEMDSSIEGLSNLMAIGFTETEMEQALDSLSGAIIKFPDTLKIESLADSLQETIATGSATGQFAELIERCGGNLDEFNEKMESASTSADRQQVALNWLSQSGLSQINHEYQETNKSLIEAVESEERYNQKLAELGEVMEPAATMMNGIMADGLQLMIDGISFIGEHQEIFVPLAAGIVGAAVAFGTYTIATTGATAVTGIFTGVVAALTSPVGLAVAAVGGLIAVGVALYQNWDSVCSFLSGTWETIKTKFNEGVNFVRGLFNFKFQWPEIKMPRITVSWDSSGWLAEAAKFLGFPGVPSFGIQWNAKGGLFDRPTVLQGFGEAGPEYAIPLTEKSVAPLAAMIDKLSARSSEGITDQQIDNLANRIVRAIESITIPAPISNVYVGVDEVTDKVERKMAYKLKRSR